MNIQYDLIFAKAEAEHPDKEIIKENESLILTCDGAYVLTYPKHNKQYRLRQWIRVEVN